MAEEDEIDVLGEFNLDNLLSKNNREIYNYDNPQWALDHQNPSSWYHQTTGDFNSSLSQPIDTGFIESTDELQLNNSNNYSHQYDSTVEEKNIPSNWNNKEKDLFERALEIFGRSPGRISQFIGTKTPTEVKQYLKSYIAQSMTSTLLINDLYSDHNLIKNDNVSDNTQSTIDSNFSGLFVESQIPASIEEVIAAVNTAQPTVLQLITKNKGSRSKNKHTVNSSLQTKNDQFNPTVNFSNIPSGHSILKKSVFDKFESVKKPKYVIGNKNSFKVFQNKRPLSKRLKKHQKIRKKSNRKNCTTDLQLVTGKGLSVPLSSGEEVITIKKSSDQESDTEVEIDVDDTENTENANIILQKTSKYNIDDNEKAILDHKNIIIEEPKNNNLYDTPVVFDDMTVSEMIIDHQETITCTDLNQDFENEISNTDLDPKSVTEKCNMSYVNNELLLKLSNMNIPTEEYLVNHNIITDEEKCIHFEFFEARPTKTPERYMKIRNHILNSWYVSKPTYVTKTSVRSGLKNCGDVNSIGRIHQYLEQIGAINFGCGQTEYKRPLSIMLLPQNTQSSNSKNKIMIENSSTKHQNKTESMRPRNKKKILIDGEGGYTLKHNENGDIIETTVIMQNPKQSIPKKNIKLINCKDFNQDHMSPYQVKLHLSALLSMDWHAHTHLSEVMGLLGGYFNECEKALYITRYISCRSATNSATHCDMCPVSQTEASETIQSENLDVVGWFHSHPIFSPNPSQQDMDTQLNMQNWFFNMKSQSPFIGIILSPFCNTHNNLASDYRCLIVNSAHTDDQQTKLIPYQFKTEIISHKINMQQLLCYATKIFSSKKNSPLKIDLHKPYFQDTSITYIDKIISATKFHLSKCPDITETSYNTIIHGISRILNK